MMLAAPGRGTAAVTGSGSRDRSVEQACDRMRDWGEQRSWRGYDPYDALTSPLTPVLTLGTRLGRRMLTQAVKRSPLNLRPVLRIPPDWNAKAVALVASAYARLAAAREDDDARRQARRWLTWLVERSTADVGLGWGYHFDVQTRLFSYPGGTPNTIATSFAAQALLDGHELLGEDEWGARALEACDLLRGRLLETAGGRVYFRYLAPERELVHNANVLGCSVLARAAQATGRLDLVPVVEAALATTLAEQRADGAWPYAEGSRHGWVDNFHTGYVLEGLARCARLVPAVVGPLHRGLDFWEHALFLGDGTPKYYEDRLLPLDAHNFAQAIETWLVARSWRPGALERAERCGRRLATEWIEPDGYVAFQQTRLWRNRVPFVRWTTAPAFRALAGLELTWRGEESP
jgi:hypothetical protein